MFEQEKYETIVAGKETISKDTLPDDYKVVNELGDCFLSIEQYDNAQLCYDKAAILDPDKAGPYIGLGTLALHQGHTDEAMNAFKVATRLDGDSSKAYCGIAMLHQENEQYPQAFEFYLKCLEIDIDNMAALLGLFQTSCLMGSFSKVIEYLNMYLSMHPKDKAVLFCLATLYMKENSLEKAKTILTKLLDLEPDTTDYADLLEEVEYLIEHKKAAGNYE